jgi:hypothetical protein
VSRPPDILDRDQGSLSKGLRKQPGVSRAGESASCVASEAASVLAKLVEGDPEEDEALVMPPLDGAQLHVLRLFMMNEP